jgi:hypothetical protein
VTDLIQDLPTPTAPAGDRRTIVLVHDDSSGSPIYWAGHGNGHDGLGWTPERKEAMEFTTIAAANLERKVARKRHPGMVITMICDWTGAA